MPAPIAQYTVRQVMASKWDGVLEQFPGHSVFHTMPWFNAIQAVHGAEVKLAVAECADGKCVAAWPLFATNKGPLKIIGSPVPGWCTAYLGPIFTSECNVDRAVATFLEHPLFQEGSYFSCKVDADTVNIDLAPFGFEEVEKLDTYIIDLTQPEETLWANLKGECRTRVRKGEKVGIEVRHETDASFIADFWAMAQETFAICGIKPGFTEPFLHEMWAKLRPAGHIHALSAWHEGKRIATLVLPHDQRTMYYWAGASFIEHRKIPSHNALHWEAIKLAQSLGLKRYDFISTAGGGGRFKKTFGPERVHVATQWERTSSRVIKALKSGYQQWLAWQNRASA